MSTDVLDIEGAIVTDMNAAKRIRRFAPAPQGLDHVNKEMVFAEDWKRQHNGNLIAIDRHRAIKCAEVLIPKEVPPKYITGIYVSCKEAAAVVKGIVSELSVTINGHLFFYEEPR